MKSVFLFKIFQLWWLSVLLVFWFKAVLKQTLPKSLGRNLNWNGKLTLVQSVQPLNYTKSPLSSWKKKKEKYISGGYAWSRTEKQPFAKSWVKASPSFHYLCGFYHLVCLSWYFSSLPRSILRRSSCTAGCVPACLRLGRKQLSWAAKRQERQQPPAAMGTTISTD